MTYRFELEGAAQFEAAIDGIRWDPELRKAHEQSGRKIETAAKGKAGGLGGASAKTAGMIQMEASSAQAELKASAPFALGAEYGGQHQFANIPGANTEEGHWFGPALKDGEGDVVEEFEDMLVHATRPAFH